MPEGCRPCLSSFPCREGVIWSKAVLFEQHPAVCWFPGEWGAVSLAWQDRTGQVLDQAGMSTWDSIHGAGKRGHPRAVPNEAHKAASKDYTAAKTLGKEQEPV